jgi:C4-dicarboxylate-specific signal transduction histidine kinase
VFSDSGPGVKAAVRDAIFDPYFSTRPDGVGLGLTIAGEIVNEYYAGDLELLDSGPLPGATFRITLRSRV